MFETDKFFEYFLTYNDVEESSNETIIIEEKNDEVVPPDTFDSKISYMTITVVAASLTIYTSLCLRKRFNH